MFWKSKEETEPVKEETEPVNEETNKLNWQLVDDQLIAYGYLNRMHLIYRALTEDSYAWVAVHAAQSVRHGTLEELAVIAQEFDNHERETADAKDIKKKQVVDEMREFLQRNKAAN